jgi:ankyrin repeat protein
MCRSVLKYGAEVKLCDSTERRTPLLQATAAGNLDMVKFILDEVASIEKTEAGEDNWGALLVSSTSTW